MKNMKIRLKILVSFGVVIALTLVLGVFVVISNRSIGGQAESIRAEAHMQTLSAALMHNFLEVNKGILAISLSFSDDEYANVVSYMDECQNLLSETKELIGTDPSLDKFTGEVNALAAVVTEITARAEEIQSDNKELEAIIAEARDHQVMLTDQSMGIFDYQMELSTEETQQDVSIEDRLRRISRIEQGTDIGNRLNYIGGSFETMFKSLDTSRVAEDQQYMEETIQVLTAFLEESSLQYNIETATSMLEALDVYKKNITDFLDVLARRAGVIEEVSVSMEDVAGQIDVLLGSVEAAVMENTDATIRSSSQSLVIVVTFVLVALAISLFMAFYISGVISRPLKAMTAFMKKAGSTGDTQLSPADVAMIGKLSQVRDEIGELVGSLSTFVEHVNNTSRNLEAVAEGDLTVEAHLLSEVDTMGGAMRKMVDNLNHMFGEIHTTTEQVNMGARQIAEGSQSLAQGSTEQAASVQQLSASIAEIAQKTTDNAERAGTAAALANNIMQNVEKGNRQMGEMMEAARAGEHGKGFAVVAEEVRSLASKSAEAAKDTEELIADSIEKAELGSRIASETAAGLADIVTGVSESNRIANEIAESSQEQSAGIVQVNMGVEQVSRVVQQNSATAQQSAATSEEMSSRASVLGGLVAQFKLKGRGAGRRNASERVAVQSLRLGMDGDNASSPSEQGKY